VFFATLGMTPGRPAGPILREALRPEHPNPVEREDHHPGLFAGSKELLLPRGDLGSPDNRRYRPMTATDLCYSRDGRTTLGPVTWQELRRLAAIGELLPSDVVGPIGMPHSMKAASVPGLFDRKGEPGSPSGTARVDA